MDKFGNSNFELKLKAQLKLNKQLNTIRMQLAAARLGKKVYDKFITRFPNRGAAICIRMVFNCLFHLLSRFQFQLEV